MSTARGEMEWSHRSDAAALDEIAYMLRDPAWGVGMLEDIAEIVKATGRDLSEIIGEDGEAVPTWDRH
jgi:hypothetical protein